MNTTANMGLKDFLLKKNDNDLLLEIPEKNLEAIIDFTFLLLKRHNQNSLLGMDLIEALYGDKSHRDKDKEIIKYLYHLNQAKASIHEETLAFLRFLQCEEINGLLVDLDDIPF